jgi:hypothetical protein
VQGQDALATTPPSRLSLHQHIEASLFKMVVTSQASSFSNNKAMKKYVSAKQALIVAASRGGSGHAPPLRS